MQRLHQVQKIMAMSYIRKWHWGNKWKTELPWHTQGEAARPFHVFRREKAGWSKGEGHVGVSTHFWVAEEGLWHFRWTEKERKFKRERRVRYADDFMWNPPEAFAWRVQGSCNTSLRHTGGRLSSGCEADPQTKVQDRTRGLSEWPGAGQQRWWRTPQKRKDADRDVSGEVSPKQWGNGMHQMGLSRVSTRGTGKLCEGEGSRVWSPVKWDDSSPFLLRDEQKQEEAIFFGRKSNAGKASGLQEEKETAQ